MCADLTKHPGGIALFSGADHLERGLGTICTCWLRCNSAHCSQDRGLQRLARHPYTNKYTILNIFVNNLMCCLLASMFAYFWCLGLLENGPVTWPTTTAVLPSQPDRNTLPPFAWFHTPTMICIRGVWSGSGALDRSLSWLARVLSTLPSPTWLDPGAGASNRAQHLALQTPTSHQAKKQF
jgi:hypothetical protein